jgi:succinate dehydrogenase / fumarate reductase flavoprotein subunit
MQGLADGYFVLPNTIGDYLADGPFAPVTADGAQAEVTDRIAKLLAVQGDRTVDSFHRELGSIMWDYCGMERTDAGLRKALTLIRDLRDEFWQRVNVPGGRAAASPHMGMVELNQSLERAGRVADFFELAELMCIDALHRTESCGGHFRAESQTADGEAQRDDERFSYVAAWQHTGAEPVLHKENLTFDYVNPSTRSYK